MDNPLLSSVISNFPDVDPKTLQWPEGANSWTAKDLELFIGSGGFLKPKKKKAEAPKAVASSAPPAEAPAPAPPVAASALEEKPSAFEVPGFSVERHAITMPVRVHCEDTTPHGHVRIESLTAYAERIRSLCLKQLMGVSLADLKERKLAILATEYVVEIVGASCRVLDTLRLDTTPEFPSAPLFPWEAAMYSEDGTQYMRGRFGLNLCQISESGAYSGIDEKGYREFTKEMLKWSNPGRKAFSPTSLRFFNAYEISGKPFKPTSLGQATYVVRASDCDMYNVLFQARVPSFLENCGACGGRTDLMAMYVNIRTSVRPGEELAVHVFSEQDRALFLCVRGREAVVTAFGHYGSVKPVTQEEIKCASVRLPLLLRMCTGQSAKPPACEDFDLSGV